MTDRWYGSDQRWWKVETVDGLYIVRLDESTGTWELAAVVGKSFGVRLLRRAVELNGESEKL